MKFVAYCGLAIVTVACIGIGISLFRAPLVKETWATLAALLAVVAAVIGVFPAWRVLQVQEDSQRPRPTPYFDLTSRYDFVQLRVKNVGASVAYDIQLTWKSPLIDHEGKTVQSLDRISVLLPQESASTLIGTAHGMVRKLGDAKFEGECSFKDASGKKYKDAFVCSVDAHQHQLLHDNELPRTLRDLQDIPKELARLADLLEKMTPPSEPPSEEELTRLVEKLRLNKT